MDEINRYEAIQVRLAELLHLTNAVSHNIETTRQQVRLITNIQSPKNMTDAGVLNLREPLNMRDQNNKSLPRQVGYELWWEIKRIYQEHFDTIQQYITIQKLENQYLQDQLIIKEREDEINKCYIISLERANEIGRNDLQTCKAKCKELKKELRQIKDRLLVFGAQERISLYLGEKNGDSSKSCNLRNCLRVEQNLDGSKGNSTAKENNQLKTMK